MNTDTIKAIRYIDVLLEILAEIYQYDFERNDWHKCTDSATWEEWSREWLEYVNNDVAAYGANMYRIVSRCNIVPIHVVPHKPIVNEQLVDWIKVGNIIRSHFRT